MPWAQTLGDLSPHLSLHTSACALVSACCSFLPSFSQRVSPGTRDPPLHASPPHLPLRAPCACTLMAYMHVQAAGASVQLRSLSRCSMLPSPRQLCWGPNNPVCSRPCTEVSEPGSVNNLRAVSAGFRTLRWCITASRRKWPDTHTCFLSTKITLRQARWEFQADRPAALCLRRTNRVCAGRVGALFFLSETGMNNSRACHNTPRVKFHIFTASP